jgi:hypothetical protein
MTKTVEVPEYVRDMVQKANMECDSRKSILLAIIAGDVNVSEERAAKYQEEYDEKFFAFEQAKAKIEKEYVLPAVNGKANNWSLDYATCVITITVND